MGTRVAIDRLGQRGDGIAAGPIFVSYALPGETVEIDPDTSKLRAIIAASPDRDAPFCSSFGRCGGCATQHMKEHLYRAWKQSLVAGALKATKLETDLKDMADAHGEGRRRATFHARNGVVGFAMLSSHDLVAIESCPVCVPAISEALPALRAIETILRGATRSLDFLVTASKTGLDIDLRGAGGLAEPTRLRLIDLAVDYGLARLSNHGDGLIERHPPMVRFGAADVVPPAGGFLQATEAADRILAGLVGDALGDARHVADLFSGCGTLTFPIAEKARVTAMDNDAKAIQALLRAARRTAGLKPIRAETRDLFRRPLLPDELISFDAVVFDPPRAGASAQAQRIAASKVGLVVAVSCNVATFIRDAAILIAGGFRLERLTPVDQFKYTPHVELVGVFRR